MKTMPVVFSLLFFILALVIQAQDERAPFETLTTTDGYEERVYPPTKWVCHMKEKSSFSMMMQFKAFASLFSYIQGENEEGVKIPMTRPVTIRIRNTTEGMLECQMCFYIPSNLQDATPVPTKEQLYIEERPELTLFSRTFGGYALKRTDWEREANILRNNLTDAEEDADLSYFYMVGYNSPFELANRTNDVWFLKNNSTE